MSAVIISPLWSGISSKMELLNNAARKVLNICQRKGEEPVDLTGENITSNSVYNNPQVKGNIRLFLFYGAISNGAITGSDGKPILDVNNNDHLNSIEGKVLYIISDGPTLETLGRTCKRAGVTSYFGFSKGMQLPVSLSDKRVKSFFYAILNCAIIKICRQNWDPQKAERYAKKLCRELPKILLEEQKKSGKLIPTLDLLSFATFTSFFEVHFDYL